MSPTSLPRSFAILGLAVFVLSPAFAQEPAKSSGTRTSAAKASGDSSISSGPAVSVMVVPGGMRRHVPGRWTMMAVNGLNSTERDVEELVTVQLGEDNNSQYARRLWIPAGARRQTWMPALMPTFDAVENPQITMKSIRLKESDGEEQFQANRVGSPISERSLMVSSEQARTAVVFDTNESSKDDAERIEDLLRSTYICRDSVSSSIQDLGLVRYSSLFLPTSPKGLDSVDHLIVGGDRLDNDTAARDRIHDWVREGGRLWVMLDQMSATAARELLGDAACFSEVDRVELTDFSLGYFGESSDTPSFVSDWSSDRPVSMVRVFAEADEVQCRIDGWPSVFWKSYGEGEILCTTFGARGFIDGDHPIDSFRSVASEFFVPRARPAEPRFGMKALMDKEIGYEIPSRRFVAMVLGAHTLLMLLVGAWLAKKRNLHHLAVLVPVAAVLATAFLLFIGSQNTSSTPSTIAAGQFARVSPSGTEIQVEGTTAIFSQEGRPLNVTATSNTVMILGDGEADGELKRILWTDDGKSQWMHLQQPPGVVRHVTSKSTIALRQPWSVKGRFSERGFEGQLIGLDPSQCEDALIVSDSTPSLAVAPDDSSGTTTLVGGVDDVLLEDQFTNQTFMTDRQRGRQSFLRELITGNSRLFGRDPSMLLWTHPLQGDLIFDTQFQFRGSALVSLPISYERSAPSTPFAVPANFVRMEMNAGELGFSALYNPQTGRWLDEMTKASSAALDCFVPANLLPCELSAATIDIKLNAPSRTLALKGLVNGQYETLFEKENPSGLIRVRVDQMNRLQVSEQGAFRLLVSVSATAEESAVGNLMVETPSVPRDASNQPAITQSLAARSSGTRSVWHIEFLRVSFRGKTK